MTPPPLPPIHHECTMRQSGSHRHTHGADRQRDRQDRGSFDRLGDLWQQWSDVMMDVVQHCTCRQTGDADEASFTNFKQQCYTVGPMCMERQSRRAHGAASPVSLMESINYKEECMASPAPCCALRLGLVINIENAGCSSQSCLLKIVTVRWSLCKPSLASLEVLWMSHAAVLCLPPSPVSRCHWKMQCALMHSKTLAIIVVREHFFYFSPLGTQWELNVHG